MFTRAVHGSWSGPRARSGGIKKLAGRVGSGREVFEMSPVGSGRVRRLSNPTGHPERIRLVWYTER